MKKIKKLLTIGLAGLLMLCVSVSLVGCRPYHWEIEEKRIFDEANKIARHPDYALITDYEYRSAEKVVVWEDLIVEKIKADGKEIENTFCSKALFLKEPNTIQGGFVAFTYRYDSESPFFGLNKNKEKYALGTMSLDDYSFKIHYLRLPYATFYVLKVSETHFCCEAYDNGTKTYVLINRESGKIEETWEDFDLVKENFKNEIPNNYNHSVYTENGVAYTVTQYYVENEAEDISIRIPSYEYVMERSQELQRINVAAGAYDNTVSRSFVTNGTELFIIYSYALGMFGGRCHLIPVVFRCDTSLETFEYVGCLSKGTSDPEAGISVVKTNEI